MKAVLNRVRRLETQTPPKEVPVLERYKAALDESAHRLTAIIAAGEREDAAAVERFVIGRTLTRRLEDLEAQIRPGAEPTIITIEFVAGDRKVVDTLELKVAAPPPTSPRARPWRR